MLTPVDIQQKKFHMGLGYEKKDVNDFFAEVLKSYEELYRSNAELKEEVASLNDTLVHYKSKEEAMEKTMLLAEKNSEDKKSKASKEAKSIELEAKNKAKVIVGDAEKRLASIKDEIALLESKYASYKSEFATMLKRHFQFLEENDFDVDSKIDERFAGVVSAAPAPAEAGSGNAFGTFDGDPQMRDESSLGGMSHGAVSKENINSTSAVYTSNLGAGENFVDPFDPNKKDDTRFNPFADPDKPQKRPKVNTNFNLSSEPGKNRVRTNNSNKAQNNEKKTEKKEVPQIKVP